MNILVIGGAGYIGSHMVKQLGGMGCQVTTLDNLSNGHRDAVLHGKFVMGDLADSALLAEVLHAGRFDAVMHFASFIQVGESVEQPAKYYDNNVANTLHLLEAMRIANIKRFIFSSTAATFGVPQYTPIDETHPQNPINPYGRSKLMVEQMLEDFDRAYGLKSVCLRYFNAAGADPEGKLGERHSPETHLIPLVLQAASGKRSHISVFGRDYDTPDGTCIRDYVHVSDLCEAHWLGLQSLMHGAGSQHYNLGNGNGFSVQEVIDTAKWITGKPISVLDAPRRNGDPTHLVADATRAKQLLGWNPQYTDLRTIVTHSWKWEQCQVI
ncbi:UDP-glucose 4-epimerase GalE [Limnohabitans sp. T6-20]|uniref:UDP-glucose 4-epimerase GalE n=1 Tax=Limnohabitans sp. T6-20 TaxID=1100725 RepID=UPI000D3CD305|nr:UDP-glucose 4-epimerase GalE [Limnohabitans sp. T6-20]PUE09978.1 UDP-glucose 4-epimerase GalE [Limnohabitans sp. T6-20]